MPGFQRILVGFDGSKGAEAAFGLALEIAARFGASVDLLAVLPPSVTDWDLAAAEERALLREPLERCAERAREKKVPFSERIETGDPAQRILEAARRGRYDLLVVGRRKLARPVYWILGSVSEQVIRHSPCPVLVVEPSA
ncbi:Nucleotide-binding protein, UspA family [Methylacidimicrobium sp. AP8]|uniref:universal stress protein n=1 Tax=Methylacidimicrobium sp. AP8 TaxID=2730359 RepID=UPI0018BFA19D|nr:universal stress protein [Methylacidimicrobium sp. AP8]CAB4243964.1 Nucleotide-binding protein, UspA family [Methylacidimicrobium sp. AP8]